MWVVGHRGASGYAPENTIASFRRAVELGAGFIETDLQVTRDVQVVAMHDSTLDRTTSGKGPVSHRTLDEIRVLDAGSWFDSDSSRSFAGERVPTLNEILDLSRELDVNFYLEIKAGDTWGVEHAVAAALSDSNAAGRALVLSFDLSTLDAMNRIDRNIMTGYLCEHPSSDLVKRAVQVGARQLAPRGDLITSALVDQAHRAGLKVVTWTINEPEQMRHLIATGVDGIMSDYPDRLVSVLRET
jgi:glycerophosphoryl diester phosphodiesterase